MQSPRILIQQGLFNAEAETAALREKCGDVGALVTFTGLCRQDGDLIALELEHYSGMAERQIADIIEEAAGRWPLLGACVIHRVGRIPVGEPIVLVAAASAHRQAAFAGADFIMDFLKSRAPFWKRGHTRDGASDWVDAKESDEAALSRWG